jgi:hypothetical protein
MAKGSRRSTAPPPQPPANAAEGAARVRGLVMKVFDKGDGDGANWRLCAESLFWVAFNALDRVPDPDEKKALANRIYAAAYDRVSGNSDSDFAASKTGPGEGGQSPSNTFDLKSSPEGPGK